MINVFIGVVIFSQPAEKTETLRALSQIDFDKLNIKPFFFIRDNSKDGHPRKFFDDKLRYDYFVDHDFINQKLSVVYNQMVAYSVKNKTGSDMYVFLDDDSKINDEYFHKLIDFYESEASVGIPIIHNNDEVISPGKLDKVKGRSITREQFHIGVNENDKFVAMMSGTAIKETVFSIDKIMFCEKLSFYGVDTKFFLDFWQKHNTVFILDYSLQHHSALRDKNYDFNSMYARLSNVMRAHFYIFSNERRYKIKLFTYFPRFILGKVVKFKDLRFLILFKNYNLFWKLDNE